MREKFTAAIEEGRVIRGYFASKPGDPHGAFRVMGPCGEYLTILSSGGDDGWEHVSVSIPRRTPNWKEMCFVKDAFWNDDEVVMQLHPAKAEYVNFHPYCLHLWRPLGAAIPLPPFSMVGPKTNVA